MNGELDGLRARCERLTLLQQVSRVIHSTLDAQQALALILQETVRVTRATSGSVILINPGTGFLEIHASHGLPEHAPQLRLRVGEGITGWVARTGKAARVSDVTTDGRYVRLRPEVRSELAVPLEVNGEVRGVLNVDADRVDAFCADDQSLLEALAVEAARVIHNTWLYEQLRQKAELSETLVNIGQTINSTLDLDDALSVITREACVLMRAKVCSLMMLDETHEWLDLRASHGASEVFVNKPRLNVQESLLGVVLRRQKPLQEENVQTSGRYQNPELARREGLVSVLSVPLNFAGQAVGVLSVYKSEPYVFSNEEVRVLTAFAQLSAIALEKARLYERVVDVEEQLRRNEKLSVLGLIAAEVVHEIRNPLTVMKMLYHSLDLKFPADDPRARDAEVMGRKMDDLNRIMERILDLTRVAEPTLTRVDVNQLIDDLGLLTRHRLKQQGIELVRDLEADLPLVSADATQIEQAFLNVALNAAEAMSQGGRLAIRSSSVRPDEHPDGAPTHVRVEFEDTGEGMPEAQRRTAFTSLLQSTKRKGTGLGLAIVHRVTEAHRGTVSIKSSPGRGTTLTILLPL